MVPPTVRWSADRGDALTSRGWCSHAPRRFIRLNRGTLANVDMIALISLMPGGTYVATLSNGQELSVSRIQSRTLRETLLKL
jgi:DNA-binding LytR/AlgR family response regulator